MKFKECVFFIIVCVCGCAGKDVVQVTTVSDDNLGEKEIAQIAEIKEAEEQEDVVLENVTKDTTSYTVDEYLDSYPGAGNENSADFSVGGYDILDITVYEEPDLTLEKVRVSADGYISFPLIGRLDVDNLTTSQIENLISRELAENEIMLNAHVSVFVREYKSKQFKVMGSVKQPGSYSLKARERILDALSKTGGIDSEQAGKEAMLIRTHNPGTDKEEKIVIRIGLTKLLKGGDQVSNLLLADKDSLYIPKAESFYIMGQVVKPGSYPYLAKEITLVEAISKAGGFTPVASRNRTRIVRVEDGVNKIIQVKVDAITGAGKKGQDVLIRPGDIIVIPESFF